MVSSTEAAASVSSIIEPGALEEQKTLAIDAADAAESESVKASDAVAMAAAEVEKAEDSVMTAQAAVISAKTAAEIPDASEAKVQQILAEAALDLAKDAAIAAADAADLAKTAADAAAEEAINADTAAKAANIIQVQQLVNGTVTIEAESSPYAGGWKAYDLNGNQLIRFERSIYPTDMDHSHNVIHDITYRFEIVEAGNYTINVSGGRSSNNGQIQEICPQNDNACVRRLQVENGVVTGIYTIDDVLEPVNAENEGLIDFNKKQSGFNNDIFISVITPSGDFALQQVDIAGAPGQEINLLKSYNSIGATIDTLLNNTNFDFLVNEEAYRPTVNFAAVPGVYTLIISGRSNFYMVDSMTISRIN